MTFSKTEKIWGSCIFFLLLISMAFVQVKDWPMEFGDSAYFAEMVDNIRHEGKPMTQVNAGILVALQAMYGGPAQACKMPLGYLPPINEFHLHFYSIIYAIAPFSYLLPAPILLPGLMTLCFIGLLALLYCQGRRLGLPIGWMAVLCFLVSLHPAWKLSIFGQSYVDRLFLLTGWLYLAALSSARPRFGWIALAGIACAAVNDRTGTLCAIITFGYLILFPRRLQGKRILIAGLAICFAAFSYYLVCHYILNLAVGFFRPLAQTFDFSDLQKSQLLLMAAVTFPLFFLAAWDWRGLLLSVAMMLPNIFGTIGGAEKTGWETHYHSYYLPVLAWAALRGFKRFQDWSKIGANLAPWRPGTFRAVMGVLIAFALTIDPHDLDLHFRTAEIGRNPWTRSFAIVGDYLGPADRRPENVFTEIQRLVPAGASITMIETGMPTLYPGHKLYLLPAGIDYTDYLVLSIKEKRGSQYIYTDISPYTDPVTRKKLNDCLYGRMRKGGFDLDHPQVFGGVYALIKRRRS